MQGVGLLQNWNLINYSWKNNCRSDEFGGRGGKDDNALTLMSFGFFVCTVCVYREVVTFLEIA